MKRLLLLFSMTAVAFATNAQVQQVADLYPGSFHSVPNYLTPFGSRLTFLAADSLHGYELWTYSGTGAPVMVADMVSGTDGIAVPSFFAINEHFAELNGAIYFPGGNTNDQAELYRWDGGSNPVLVANINPGNAPSQPASFIVMNNTIYFAATSAATGRELYSYNGSGAPVLHELNIGSASTNPSDLIAYNGKIYFAGQGATVGLELFVYDPVTNGISLVSDIEPGVNWSDPMMPHIVGGKLCFRATTIANGNELYVYDGSAVTRITDLYQNGGDGVDNIVGELNRKLYFQGSKF